MANSTNDIVWSSKASSRAPQNPVAALLESGNLVVKDGNDNNPDHFLWQSFDYPGVTLLPGMKIGRNFLTGLDSFLSSWKSLDDPGNGEFTIWIEPHAYPQRVLKRGNSTQIRVGSWNGISFTGLPQLKSDPQYTFFFVINEKEVYHKYEIRNKSLLVRLVLGMCVVQRYTWRYRTGSWAQINAVVIDSCDTYALCGSNAACNISNKPQCVCLAGFVPKSSGEWNQLDWSGGCVPHIPLDCENKIGFLKYEAVKLPDTSDTWFDKTISLMECKKLCSNNCSCKAYANLDVREGASGCLIWFHDLVDIRVLSEGGQDLYIKLALSELENIEARRPPTEKKHVIIVVTCIISAILEVLVLGWIVYIWKKKLRRQEKTCYNYKTDENEEGSKTDGMELPIYGLNTIAKATDNFSNNNKLGEDGFGLVYK